MKFGRGKVAPHKTACPKCGCLTARKQVVLPFVPKRHPEPVMPPILPPPPDPWGPSGPWHPRRYWWDSPIMYRERMGFNFRGLNG